MNRVTVDRRIFLHATLALVALPLARGAFAADAPLKIGMIGSGRIGSTIGGLWLKAGHEVMFSSRELEKDKALAEKLGGKARAGTTQEAAAFGDVVMIGVPYGAMPVVGRELAPLLKGKVVIDASNPILPRDGEVGEWARKKGAGLATAELIPGARIVRAFNAIGYARVADAGSRKVGMPIAGEDAAAIEIASRLVRDTGLEPVLVGGLAKGRYLIPGTALAGEHPPEKLRQIAATLD